MYFQDDFHGRGVCFFFLSLFTKLSKRFQSTRVFFFFSVESYQDHGLEGRIDYKIMEQAKEALESKTPVSLKMPISNLDRTTGTILSYNISTK